MSGPSAVSGPSSTPDPSSEQFASLPLPKGWLQQFDKAHDHPYWVDTRADPPRAIWVHPYEDELFLSEHPEIRAQLERRKNDQLDVPPPYESVRRHSFSGASSSRPSTSAAMSSRPNIRGSASNSEMPAPDVKHADHDPDHKRGLFDKLKDKTIGTKEEREAEKKRKEEKKAILEEQRRKDRERFRKEQELRRQEYERRRQQQLEQERAQWAAYDQQRGFGYGQPNQYQNQYQGGYAPMYGPPVGTPYDQDGYSTSGYARRRHHGMTGGNIALPLIGGLAGGLLLGDLLDGGFGGGGFGGGGFGGGFGGGGFGGGGGFF